VDVYVMNFTAASGCGAYEIFIDFDETQADITGVTGGDAPFDTPVYDLNASDVTISDYHGNLTGPTGNFKLCELAFDCPGAGVSIFDLTIIELLDCDGNDVTANAVDGTITQQTPTPTVTPTATPTATATPPTTPTPTATPTVTPTPYPVWIDQEISGGVVVLRLTLDTGATAVRGFEGRAVYGNEEMIMMDAAYQQDGDSPFIDIDYTVNNPGNLTGFDKDAGAGNETLQPVIARLVPRLTGCCTNPPADLYIYIDHIYDASWTDIGSAANSTSFLRGDVTGEGAITISDALGVTQYLLGEKTLGEIEALNAASIAHGGDSGDSVTISDALGVTQYLLGEKDCYFN